MESPNLLTAGIGACGRPDQAGGAHRRHLLAHRRRLVVIGTDGTERVLAGVSLPRAVYVDSPTRRIDVLDFDSGTGQVAGRRPFADLASVPGLPGGLTVDTEGGVWVALHGGGVLHRYGPDGALDTVATLPVSHPTSCAFGGPELADLYVTTASAPLSAAERAAQP